MVLQVAFARKEKDLSDAPPEERAVNSGPVELRPIYVSQLPDGASLHTVLDSSRAGMANDSEAGSRAACSDGGSSSERQHSQPLHEQQQPGGLIGSSRFHAALGSHDSVAAASGAAAGVHGEPTSTRGDAQITSPSRIDSPDRHHEQQQQTQPLSQQQPDTGHSIQQQPIEQDAPGRQRSTPFSVLT